MADLDIIENFITNHAISLPKSCQLVFDLFVTGATIETKYYFVNHQMRSIFFLDTFVVEPWIDTPGRLGEPFLSITTITSGITHAIPSMQDMKSKANTGKFISVLIVTEAC
jgi:hypothetical protein